MTMFPAHLSSSNYVNGGFSSGGYDCFISLRRGFVSDLMAEDESRIESSMDNEEAGSSMKDVNIHVDDDDNSRWLQLSLGGGLMQPQSQSTTSQTHREKILTAEISAPSSVDLDLFPGGGSGSLSQQTWQPLAPPPPLQPRFIFQGHHSTSTAFFLQPLQAAAALNSVQLMTLQQQQQTNYNYMQPIRPFPANMTTSPLNPLDSSSSSFSGSSDQQGRPVHVHRRLNVARVVNPPRRPHSGVWFMLQASQNQLKEPFLPQIPKSYLRIKDGRMTVGLLIKYLVNKLELGSESEIEITCKGHQLLSLSTLQHVRDTIWNSPRNDVGFTVIPQSPATINHLMVLNYGRIA
ncbi:uncharacterized protein LOC143599890 [Bidens hawaiensis]|uniref:uncharacterized protein LOC143599890 n=1 Tax=Bidens hawaiensis TaxID=980011 RepID=UPI00404B28A0